MNWSRLLGGGGRTAGLAVAAGVATALTFLAVRLLAPPGGYAYGLFFERGYIQYVAVYCFWATVATLAVNNLALVRERAAFERAGIILAEPRFAGVMIWSDAAVVREAFEADRRHAASVTFSRVTHALDRLRRMQSTKALDDYFRNRSDLDGSKLETSYAGVRYFVWLLPTLGLIGTVMGMGRAISGFGTVLQEAQNFLAVKQALPDIMRELGTAFDTTFLGVGLSAVAAATCPSCSKPRSGCWRRSTTCAWTGCARCFRSTRRRPRRC